MKAKFLLVGLLAVGILSCSKKNDPDPDPDRNPYDGRYRMEGTLTDHVNPVYVWPGNTYEYRLETNSPTQVTLISKDLGMAGHLLKNGINLTYYGTFGLTVNFDPATNKITSISNSYGTPSANGRSAELDPSGLNKWDPATKNITIKYWMNQTGVVGHATSFDETWVYIGQR